MMKSLHILGYALLAASSPAPGIQTSSTKPTTATSTSTSTSTSPTCLVSPILNGNFANGSTAPWTDHKNDGWPDIDESFPWDQGRYDWGPAITSDRINGSFAYLSQILNTCAGSNYVCSFKWAWTSDYSYGGRPSEIGLRISVNGGVLFNTDMTNYVDQYTYYTTSVSFVAKGNDELKYEYLELTPTSDRYYWTGWLGKVECALTTTTTPTTTTTTHAATPTSTTCSSVGKPVINGDFSTGQLAPWTHPNTGNQGMSISSFAPPGHSHSWSAHLNSTDHIHRLSIRSTLNTCANVTYNCSFQHAFTMVDGNVGWVNLYVQVNGSSYFPINGYLNQWPNQGQWYTETFSFVAQGSHDFIDFVYKTWYPTRGYDYHAYITDFQCNTTQSK